MRQKALRSFPNRYLFSLYHKVTSSFSIRYILRIILQCKTYAFRMQNNRFYNVLVMRRLDHRCSYEEYLHIYKLLLASKWTAKSR
ncbi:hypothetical protein PIOMA14_I_1527 [Prevotella intermedia]|uniref:Uncharacterized protein n=1 Tax=Prevotella intermedia TaxID=28131 RepID=A0A0S3UKK5_PREIN|nr:hypothetical protein PIOMA14_I_1527 [Prevotella intermedia]